MEISFQQLKDCSSCLTPVSAPPYTVYGGPVPTIRPTYTHVLSRSLQIFLDVASHRSFSKAAEARGMSQPAISQAVAQLEERLGEELIETAAVELPLA